MNLSPWHPAMHALHMPSYKAHPASRWNVQVPQDQQATFKVHPPSHTPLAKVFELARLQSLIVQCCPSNRTLH